MVNALFHGRTHLSPNQRKQGKKRLGHWLSHEEKNLLEQTAKAYGISMTALLKMATEDYAKRKGIKLPKQEQP